MLDQLLHSETQLLQFLFPFWNTYFEVIHSIFSFLVSEIVIYVVLRNKWSPEYLSKLLYQVKRAHINTHDYIVYCPI